MQCLSRLEQKFKIIMLDFQLQVRMFLMLVVKWNNKKKIVMHGKKFIDDWCYSYFMEEFNWFWYLLFWLIKIIWRYAKWSEKLLINKLLYFKYFFGHIKIKQKEQQWADNKYCNSRSSDFLRLREALIYFWITSLKFYMF